MENLNKENKIIKGALLLGISSIIVKILGLIYKVPLSYILSDEGMGYFNTAYSIYTFFYVVCTSGVPKAISILVSKSETDGENEKTDKILKTAITLFTSIGLIATILLMLTADNLTAYIGSRKSYYSILCIAPSVLFVCTTGVIRGYFNGKLCMLPIAISELISGVAKLVIGLMFALFTYKLNMSLYIISSFTILGTTFGSFAGFLYLFFYCKKHKNNNISRQKRKTTLFSLKTAREILHVSIPLSLTGIIGSLSGIFDATIIMKKLQLAAYTELQSNILFGNYTTLVLPMLNFIAALISPISAAILPFIVQSVERKDRVLINKTLDFTIKIISYFIFPISIIFMFAPINILSLVFENSSSTLAAPLLICLVPGIIFMSYLTIVNTTIEGFGYIKIPLISIFIGTVLKFALTPILVESPSFGIIGAPIGTSASYTLSLIFSIIYIHIKENIKIKLFSSVIFPMIISILCGIVLIILQEKTTIHFVVLLLIFLICYLILSLPFIISIIKSRTNESKYTKNVN